MGGQFLGGGLGVGVQSPGVAPPWRDNWVSFETLDACTFHHFDGTLCRFTTVGAGFLVGYSVAYISFPLRGANSISVGGLNLGAIGGDASANVGSWEREGEIPEAEEECVEATSDPSARLEYVHRRFSHTTTFDMASAHISQSEIRRLGVFVDDLLGYALSS